MNRIALALIGVSLLGSAAQAAPLGKEITIGYVQIADDSRYDQREGPAETEVTPPRPVAGAEMALDEVNLADAPLGRSFKLEKAEVDNAGALAAKIDMMAKNGTHWFLVDAGDADMAALAKAEKGKDVLLLNIAATGDALRGADCQADLVNVIPSRAMLTDALAQLLVARKWPEVLVLQGPAPEDKAMVASFEHAAKRFGLKIAAKRDFIISNDPREREKTNIALLTGDAAYDTIFVADADGSFARSLPYASIRARPVIGSSGLVPVAWTWAWERYGAPQVSHRFAKANQRSMESADWAAWIAVRSLADAVRESHADTVEGVDRYLLGPQMNIDGAKGPPLSFRAWDHQLRQPILLSTADAVIADAPMPGFLHQTNVLDTLGYDKPETECHF